MSEKTENENLEQTAGDTKAAEETAEQAAETAKSAETAESVKTGETVEEAAPEGKLKGADRKRLKKAEADLAAANKKLEETEKALQEEKDKYMRMLAEYDNFRRRTAKEKESIYGDACADTVKGILPVIDTLERAAAGLSEEDAASPLGKGITMTLKSATDALGKLNVTEIETEVFNPDIHEAVMHVEDESLGEGAIVDVFQKGYRRGDHIIRYAMVKVAN